MRNHQQCPPEAATLAKLGEATFKKRDQSSNPWHDTERLVWLATEELILYGATFWKPIIPEPGYRLVEDHERVGEKPEGVRFYDFGLWRDCAPGVTWVDDCTYAVPIKQVVAVTDINDGKYPFAAYFTKQEDRDRAVREANEREV